MEKQTIATFNVIGIAIRTTNEEQQSSRDIPALWDRFFRDRVLEKIPGKTASSTYCVYTDYEKDHTKPYTTIVGCRVENLDHIPDGMTGKKIGEATYEKRIARGNIQEGMVFKEWQKIWNTDLARLYTSDFEVYDEGARDPEHAEVAIFIAVAP